MIAITPVLGSVGNASASGGGATIDPAPENGIPRGIEWARTINDTLMQLSANHHGSDEFSLLSGNQKCIRSDLLEEGKNGSGAEFNFRKLHKYLGYSTIFLAGVAAFSSSNRSLHYGSASAVTGTALATCLTGYIEYRHLFNLDI